MPASAAVLHGRRRVMSETSDFAEKMGQRGPAALDAMLAAAAWQAAWGVTDFRLYYQPTERKADEYREYCEFVGRLNAVMKPAQPVPEVLLYYPIYDLWAEYRPVAERLQPASQSPLLRRIVSSFMRLGSTLQCSQLPFVLIDHELLAAAKVEGRARLTVGGQSFTTLVLPEGVELPSPAAAVVDQFRRAGGRVRTDRQEARLTAATLADAVKPAYCLSPPSVKIALGRFLRDGRAILLLVNVGQEPYVGQLSAGREKAWTRMDPRSGAVEPVAPDAQGCLPLALSGRQTVILVGSKR
jgi:hypothetical protein